MATAFTEKEREIILTRLKEAARHFSSTIGMRKTTVDDLVAAADISKGAFYKFYESKELLFFKMMEDLHTEIYGRAEEVLHTQLQLSPGDRIACALLTALDMMAQNSMMDFFENELSYLLRKVPQEALDKHFHSDDHHILMLIESSGIALSQSPEVISAVVRALVLTVSHRKQIGEQYDTVLKLMVRSICHSLVASDQAN